MGCFDNIRTFIYEEQVYRNVLYVSRHEQIKMPKRYYLKFLKDYVILRGYIMGYFSE